MRRRSFLIIVAASASAGCATAPSERGDPTHTDSPPADTTPTKGRLSCADDGAWEPTVHAEDVEVAPGRKTTFDIRVEPVSTFRFDGDLYSCGRSDAPVRFGDVSTDPPPDRQADSCPPYWLWDECLSVILTVPVEVAPDAEPGEYEYGFSVSGGAEFGSSSHTRTVRVSDS